MSLRKSIELIRQDISEEVFDRILASINDKSDECSGDMFSFRKHDRALDLKVILERRLKMSESKEVTEWLKAKLELLKEILHDGDLYQGYIIEGKCRIEFAIIPKSGKYISFVWPI